jgi:hypothetical protein
MRRSAAVTAAFALAAAAGAAGPAAAAPLAGPVLAQAIAGAEHRGAFSTLRGFVNVIWRFQPGGQVTAVYTLDRSAGLMGYREQGSDVGAWTVQGDRICVAFRQQIDWNGCYVVDVGPGNRARFVGPVTSDGTLDR